MSSRVESIIIPLAWATSGQLFRERVHSTRKVKET
jgi:hypothetical protein